MKKVLALMLALSLVAATAIPAFADHTSCADANCELDDHDHLQPGESYYLEIDGLNSGLDYVTLVDIDGFDMGTAPGTLAEAIELISEDNYNFKADIDWSVGGALVNSLKFDDDDWVSDSSGGTTNGAWILSLNENFTISSEKELSGTIIFETSDSLLTSDDAYIELEIDASVSNHLAMVSGYSDLDDAEDDAIEAVDNTIYQCEEDESGYVVFNDQTRLFTTTLKMIEDEKAFMFNSEEMIDDVEDRYGYIDADIECYQFGGSPTFTNEAAFSLQADYADQYFVYEWDGSSLTSVDYEWDSINGIYKWATKTPTDYVISDTELVAGDEVTDEDSTTDSTYDPEENPDTGANDVVGVAAALAVISLVAAGAVTIKNKK